MSLKSTAKRILIYLVRGAARRPWITIGASPTAALERQRRQVARANRINAAYVAKVEQQREAAAPCSAEEEFQQVGIADLPRPIYPARQTVWLDGTASKQLSAFAVSKICAWPLEACTDDVASELGYCVRHTRRVTAASTPEVTR